MAEPIAKSSQPQAIDPDGDTILVLGSEEEAVTLGVSSKILSLSSPVFAAMLSPKFSEGSTLFAAGRSKIPLPDDDHEAMTWVCEALHFRPNFTADISFELLEKIAVLCDKYDFTVALKAWTELCLWTFEESARGERQWSTIMWMAYVFDNQAFFHYSSLQLLEACMARLPGKQNGEHEYCDLLPSQIINSIILERERLTTILQESVDTNAIEHVQSPDSKQTTMTHYTQELHRIGLWPPSKVFRESTVAQLLQRFRNFRDCQRPRNCGCYIGVLSSQFHAVADEVSLHLSGLCLTCVKNGKMTGSEGNCGTDKKSACKNAANSDALEISIGGQAEDKSHQELCLQKAE